MSSVAILGFHDGNAGQVAEWFTAVTGRKIACFVVESKPFKVDAAAENKKRVSQRMEYPEGGTFKGKPLLCSLCWPRQLQILGIKHVLPLTSDNTQRLKEIQRARIHGLQLVSAVHPMAYVDPTATIAPGVWIQPTAYVGYKVELGAGTMVNTGARIEHHSVIEECCQLDPGATLAGHVTLRKTAHVHMGANIVNRVEVGEGAVIGAGALVRHNVPAGQTVIGVPAKQLRRTVAAR